MSEPTISITRSSVSNTQNEPVKTQKPQLKTHTVELPSKGYFYNPSSPLSQGKVELYQVTAKHEDILSNQSFAKKGTILEEFLKSLIATEGVSLDDMILGDKNALFIASRILAYGNLYETSVKCKECGAENKVTINLSDIKHKEFDFSSHQKGENKFYTTLPSSGKKIVIKILTHKDESNIDSEIKALSKHNAVVPEITTRLKYAVLSVDGESDKGKIKKFIDNDLLAMDSLALRKFMKESMPDIDMKFDFTCSQCGATERKSIPLNYDFFWPNTSE